MVSRECGLKCFFEGFCFFQNFEIVTIFEKQNVHGVRDTYGKNIHFRRFFFHFSKFNDILNELADIDIQRGDVNESLFFST